MTMIRYNIQTGANGSIVIPSTPFAVGEEVEVVLMEKYREHQAKTPTRTGVVDKTPEQDFLDFCEELAMPSLNDDEVDQLKYERLNRKYL